jgi:hypothetical protein
MQKVLFIGIYDGRKRNVNEDLKREGEFGDDNFMNDKFCG